MATTFLNLQDDLLAEIALDGDSDTRTKIKRFLNRSYRRVATAYSWEELRTTARITTVAPYSTGTVDVTNGSATVMASGTTFTSGAAVGMKFSLGYGYPAYEILTVDSDTQLTLTATYAGATATGQTYKVYQDTYALASNVDSLNDKHVVLLSDGDDVPMRYETADGWARYGYLPSTEGRPSRFRRVDDSSSAKQIQLWPVPDAAYLIEYAYQKMPADMSGDSDEPDLREGLRYLILMGAREDAFRLNSEHQKALLERQIYMQELPRAWAMFKGNSPGVIVREPFDAHERRGIGRYRINPWS